MVNSWQSRFRKAALEKLMNLKFSQFQLSTALSTIPSGKIWNIVPLWCCFTSLTAGFPVDFLYSSAHIRKIEYRFPLTTLNCKKNKKTKWNNLNMLQILSASVYCMYLFYCFFLSFCLTKKKASNWPPSSSVVHMQTRQKSGRQGPCHEEEKILTLFSSEETCGQKNRNRKQKFL